MGVPVDWTAVVTKLGAGLHYVGGGLQPARPACPQCSLLRSRLVAIDLLNRIGQH